MVDAASLVQFTLNGVALGGIIALSAVGLTLVYGILNLSNFSHGDLLTAGAYASLFFLAFITIDETSVVALGLAAVAVLAALGDRLWLGALSRGERALLLAAAGALVGLVLGARDGFSPSLALGLGIPSILALAAWGISRRAGASRAAVLYGGGGAAGFAAAWLWATPLILAVGLSVVCVAALAAATELSVWRPLRQSRLTAASHVLLGGFVGWVVGLLVTHGLALGGAARLGLVLLAIAAGALGSHRLLGARPIARANLVTYMIVSIGVAFTIRYALVLQFGTDLQDFPVPVRALDPILGFRIFEYQRITLVVSLVVLGLLHPLLRYSRFGKAVRALADNLDLARITGIDVDRVILHVWILAGGLTAIAGTLLALNVGTFGPELGWGFLLLMFAAVILGGIGSVYGSLVGSFAIGVTTELSVLLIDSRYKFAVAFVVLIAILLARPQGIFGVKA